MNKKEFKELDREQMIIAFNQLKDDYSSLFDELEQEKEKTPESVRKQFETYQNRICELEEKLKIATAMLTKGTYPEKNKGDNDFNKKFIPVDKIKEIVEKSFDEMLNHSNKFNCGDMQMLENNIMELLEEV